jgi:hypothetical protein
MIGRGDAPARWLLGAVLIAWGAVGAGCGQQSIVLPSRDFDRPTDMTFACLGLDEQEDKTLEPFGQPMGKCHPPQESDESASLPDAEKATFRTYAFVPNAERGDLTVIDMSYCRSGDASCSPPGAALVDLDSLSVGFGGAPLGELPEVVAASQDGCRVVSANRGSCDLTLVNPEVLLGQHGLRPGERPTKADARPYAVTVVPRTASGRLAVAPGEVYFLPQQTATHGGDQDLCDPLRDDGARAEGTLAAPVGAPAASKALPATWRAVVTFPSCDLVALMDLPSGDILDSVQVELTARMENNASVPAYAFHRLGRNPVCPVTDCGGSGPGPATDGGAPDGAGAGGAGGEGQGGAGGSAGAPAVGGASGAAGADTAMALQKVAALVQPGQPASLRVGALAIHPEGNRIYFGATNSPVIGALDITGAADTFAVPAEGASTELHDGARGIMRLRLSVDPYDYSKGHDVGDAARPEYGRFVASDHDNQPADPLEFLYAIAKDGTVRVVHVGRPVPAECDLWIDPSDPKAGAVGLDPGVRPACFPYGAADGPRRLLFAGGPGLRLGSTPQDIAFANYRTPDPDTKGDAPHETLDEQTLNGAFAFILTTTGSINILNIDPVLRTPFQRYRDDAGALHAERLPESPRPLTHSVRDANVVTYSTSLGPTSGPPRLDADPTVPVDGPHLMAFDTDETRLDARIVQPLDEMGTPYHRNTYVYFPNRATVNAQPWIIQWEGDLAARSTGDIVSRQGPDEPPAFATSISDNGAGFCGVGVDGDVMTLTGCSTTEDDCYPGTVCVHSSRVPPSVDGRVIQGMCLRQDDTTLRDRCQPMMETFRRYEVVRNTPSTAIVVPKRVEVPRPVYTNATGERAACEPSANSVPGSLYGCQPEMSSVHNKFRCLKVTTRADGTPLVAPDPAATPPVLGDVAYRCFQPCTADSDCQQGRACVAFPGTVDVSDGNRTVEKVCAEATPIDKWCGLEQLVRYRISAGNAFVVAGGSTGRTERVRTRTGANGPECVPDFTTSPTLIARVPINTPVCSPDSLPTTDGRTVTWDSTFLSRPAGPSPNPCFVFTQKNAMSTVLSTPAECKSAGALCTASVVFQNNELRFVMTDLEKPFSETTQIRFDVHGGISPQLVVPAVDAAAGLPARLVLGPVPMPAQTAEGLGATCLSDPTLCAGARGSDLPYMYIVDQRQVVNTRAGVGVRGQILRVTPRVSATTAPLPGVESFTAGGRYFPIQ